MKLLRQILGALLLLVLTLGTAFHVRIGYLVNRPLPVSSDDAADQFYFAYGANMPTRYLYNVRGVLPAESKPGTIDNHEVAFLAPGIGAAEPAFAYLLKAEGGKAHGVLHRLSAQDLVKVKESEGRLYEWATLPVELADGRMIPAQTLVRLARGDPGMPSRRYLQLLIEGAVEHNLSPSYVTQLRNMPSAYIPIISEIAGDALQAVVMAGSGKCAYIFVC